MPPISVRCLLPAALLLLCSCRMLTPLVFVGEQKRNVAPELDKLPNARVAVLVWTDPSTLFDYPHARFELASYIGSELFNKMAERKLNTEVVDPRDVEDFIQKDLDARINPRAVGKAFEAGYVVYIEVLRFQMRDAQHPQFLRGHIEASVSVHDIGADPDKLRRYELAPIACHYPDGAPITLTATNSPLVREMTYRKFAELVARKFYEHTIEE